MTYLHRRGLEPFLLVLFRTGTVGCTTIQQIHLQRQSVSPVIELPLRLGTEVNVALFGSNDEACAHGVTRACDYMVVWLHRHDASKATRLVSPHLNEPSAPASNRPVFASV